MPGMGDDERIEVASRDELSSWLARYGTRRSGIWLVSYKKGDGRYLPYDEIVDELIAHGWVDSQPRKLDETRSMRRIAPRDPGSSWSTKNRAKVEASEKASRITPAGRAAVKAGKASGAWDRTLAAERLEIPGDLAAALAEHGVRNTFDDFPPSSRRIILEWIVEARTDATRARRIAETAEKAGKGERAHHYR